MTAATAERAERKRPGAGSPAVRRPAMVRFFPAVMLGGVAVLAVSLRPYWVAKYWGERASLRKAVLLYAPLNGANLSRADLRHAVLSSANLQNACLLYTLLQGADLRGAKLANANLTAARLQGARLQRANFSEAQLQGADLRSTQLQGALARPSYSAPI